MENKFRAKVSMDEDIRKIKGAHEKLVEADKKLNQLINEIKSDEYNWEGKNKEAAISLLSLCKEYSGKLVEVSELNHQPMAPFYDGANNFMASSEILGPWR